MRLLPDEREGSAYGPGPEGSIDPMKISFRHHLLITLALVSAGVTAAGSAPAAEPAGSAVEPAATADSPGQNDLDAAVDAKLSAQSIDDFANVLDLCKRAIKKGLAADQRQFAEDLYTDTLMYRAGRIVQAIYEVNAPDPQWPRMRSFAMRDLNEVVERDPTLGDRTAGEPARRQPGPRPHGCREGDRTPSRRQAAGRPGPHRSRQHRRCRRS